MSTRRTLGGDRLGSGDKMEVEISGYGKSNFNRSKIIKTTMSAGTIVPVYTTIVTPGTELDMNLRAKVQTNPTLAALYGDYIFGVDVFEVDIRLYIGGLQYNAMNLATNMQGMKIPQIKLTAKLTSGEEDNSQIGSSCVLKYLGINGLGTAGTGWTTSQSREFNALPILGYYDICRNYYTNKQEENCYMIHTPAQPSNATDVVVAMNSQLINVGEANIPITIGQGTNAAIAFTGLMNVDNIIIITEGGVRTPIRYLYDSWNYVSTSPIELYGLKQEVTVLGYEYIKTTGNYEPRLEPIPLNDLEKIRPILNSVPVGSTYVIEEGVTLVEPYASLLETAIDGSTTFLNTQEGLMVKTYQSDKLQNFVKASTVAALTTQTNVSTTGGSFSIDALNFSIKLNNLLQREAAAGGTLKDYIEVAYGVEMYAATQIPMYLGGMRDKIVFDEVVSSAGTENQPLGQIAGKGRFLGQKKGGQVTIKAKEWAYIMAVAHITPEIDYSQGNRWDTGLKTMDDIHKPSLDQIGYQDLITEQMAYWDTINNSTGITQQSMGKQPAWINYTTDINETYGLFAEKDSMMFMTLNRRYEKDEVTGFIKDLTTYVDPAKYNYIFADTELSAQNFRVQIGIDVYSRQVQSGRLIPNL